MADTKPQPVDLGYAIGLKPAEAIRYFEEKGHTLVTGFNWHDIEAQAHARAFTVAGIMKQDLLQDIHSELQQSLANGDTLAGFKKRLLPILEQKGWLGSGLKPDADGVLEGKRLTPRRLDTIFRTNMQSAYSAGRYQQQTANKAARPYWQYVAVMDSATRPAHADLHGLTLHCDDPAWSSIYPPNGWGCRCMVRAFDGDDIKARNITVTKPETVEVQQPWGKGETRTVQGVKLGRRTFVPDAGFGHNPGRDYLPALGQRLLDRAATADPMLASVAVRSTLDNEQTMQAVTQNVSEFVRKFRADGQACGNIRHVGAMPQEVVAWLTEHKGEPQSAVITLTDDRLKHATRGVKVKPLPDSFWEALPQHIQHPQAILYDQKKDNLLWVTENPEAGKVAIHIDYEITDRYRDKLGKMERKKIKTNAILTGSATETDTLKDTTAYKVLYGNIE